VALTALDSSSVLSTARTLAAMLPQEFVSVLPELNRRYPGIDWVKLAATVTAAGPGAVGRTEWSQLVRIGQGFGVGGNVAAVAAQVGFWSIFNPMGSLVRALVKIVRGQTVLTTLFQIAATNADPAGAQASNPRNLLLDAGIAGAPLSKMAVSAGTLGGPPGNRVLMSEQPGANGAANWPPGGPTSDTHFVELVEGSGIVLTSNTVNQAFAYSALWAEVPLSYV
jgi:hypothetical protein